MFVLDSLVDLADDFATSISYEYEQSIDSFNGLFFISSSPYYWKSIETYYYNFYYFRNGYYLSVHKEDGYNYYSSQPYRENEWGKYYFAKDTLIMIDFDVRNLEPKEHKYFTFRNKYVKIEDTLFYYNFNPMVISYNLKKTNSLVNNDKIVGIWKSDSLQIVCEFNENCSFIIERGIEKDTIMGSYFVYGEEIFLKTKGILGKKFTDYYNKNSPYFFGKLYYDVENDRISVYKKYEDIDEKYKLDKPNFEYNPVYENIDKGIYFIRKDTMDRITSSALSEGGYQIEFTNYETGERDGRVFEKLNEAKFTYYDEEGNSLEQWNGNTVPAYQDIHGIARDGSYDAEWINRDKYKNEYENLCLFADKWGSKYSKNQELKE